MREQLKVENPYFEFFCKEVVFRHELPFDRSSLTRWRQRFGEQQITVLVNTTKSYLPEQNFTLSLVVGMKNHAVKILRR